MCMSPVYVYVLGATTSPIASVPSQAGSQECTTQFVQDGLYGTVSVNNLTTDCPSSKIVSVTSISYQYSGPGGVGGSVVCTHPHIERDNVRQQLDGTRRFLVDIQAE